MIPVQQRITDHDPPNGIYGDCFKCCVASILELDYDDVPHFFAYIGNDPTFGIEAFQKWLEKRCMYFYYDAMSPAQLRLPECRQWLQGYHMMFGRAVGLPESSHCVVAIRGELAYNPHPNKFLQFGPDIHFNYGIGLICRG